MTSARPEPRQQGRRPGRGHAQGSSITSKRSISAPCSKAVQAHAAGCAASRVGLFLLRAQLVEHLLHLRRRRSRPRTSSKLSYRPPARRWRRVGLDERLASSAPPQARSAGASAASAAPDARASRSLARGVAERAQMPATSRQRRMLWRPAPRRAGATAQSLRSRMIRKFVCPITSTWPEVGSSPWWRVRSERIFARGWRL